MAVTDDEDTVKTCNEIDFALLFVFVTECILKMIALGINDYFKDGWNKYYNIYIYICIYIYIYILDLISFWWLSRSLCKQLYPSSE